MSKTIEIYIACHKPSELPNNPVFIPIHVGSKLSATVMDGLQRDDEGDNISEKNPQYCEMTAQYWAWKHSQADYIGQCHYRRYLNFTDRIFTNYTPDSRKQVLVPVLNVYTEERYGLSDVEQVHKTVESYDILVPDAQDLSKVNTPFGPQNTTLKHWLAHDGALIEKRDLESLFSIVEKDYPDIYKSMREYLDTKYFYGFNTFVLRRDLFCEMCAFEFDVLEKLEETVDISHYNQQLSRIYGFMGEILSSSFIYHIVKTRPGIKLKECQMLYFDKTDPREVPEPEQASDLTYVIDGTGADEYLMYPALATLLQHIRTSGRYEIILLHHHMRGFYKTFFETYVKAFENVTIKILDVDYFYEDISERFGISASPAVMLAWILPKHNRCMYLKWHVMVQRNADAIFDVSLNGQLFGAVKDIYYQGRLNSFYKDERLLAENALGIRNIFDVISPSVLIMDLSNIRALSLEYVVGRIRSIRQNAGANLPEEALFNALFQDYIQHLDAEWNVLVRANGHTRFYCNEAPLTLNTAQKTAARNPIIMSYPIDAPWHIDESEDFYLQYWRLIKSSELEEIFRYHLVMNHSKDVPGAREMAWSVVNTVLPKGSSRREFVKRIFPKKGLVYRNLKKLINPRG